MSNLKPSNYTTCPMYSVAERIARNIMANLARTGNEWRSLSWEEYCTERRKDGNFSEEERPHFDQVSKYCESAEDANLFFSAGSPFLSVAAKNVIELKPSNYTGNPMGSVSKNWESEKIARNIMVILSRTGNEWRPITWEEYQAERRMDGGFSESEKLYFDRVISYCKSAEDADRFCSSWRK